MVVEKNALLLRDSEGKSLPIEEHSDFFGGAIKVFPMTQGEYNELIEAKDKASDEALIGKFLVEPKLDTEEIKKLPLKSKSEIITIILMGAGMSREQIKIMQEVGMSNALDALKKNKMLNTEN